MCCEVFIQACIAGVTLHDRCHMSCSTLHSLCAALALAARSLHVAIWCTIKMQPWTDCSKGMPTPWTSTECVHQHHLLKTSQHCPLSQKKKKKKKKIGCEPCLTLRASASSACWASPADGTGGGGGRSLACALARCQLCVGQPIHLPLSLQSFTCLPCSWSHWLFKDRFFCRV